MTIKKRRDWWGLVLAVSMLLLLSVLSVPVLAAEPDAVINIPIYKQVVGDTPRANKIFSFMLTAMDGAPMPEGSKDGVKAVEITGNGNASFGNIQYTELGEYHYTITETNTSDAGYTFDRTVYLATVLVTWKRTVGGEMRATLYLTKKGSNYKQDKVLFTNHYTMPAPVSVDPSVQKTVKGSPALASAFTFRLSANHVGYPMPSGSKGDTKTFSRVGAGQAEAGRITFIEPGNYSYTVSEINGGISGYTYDTTVYTMTVRVTETDGKLYAVTKYENPNGQVVSGLHFTNSYYSPSHPKTGDTANLLLWIILMAISAVLVIAAAIWKKKQTDKDPH